jgi:hydrogenase maturation protease
VLIAGVGNVFLGDDGFGVEVVRHLAARALPDGVEVVDVGIRGVHLAYDLLDGCDLLILVDAAARGAPPGTVSVLEPAAPDVGPDAAAGPALLDAHDLGPDAVLAMLARLGARPARTLVVAGEPAEVDVGMGLSAPVSRAVPQAVAIIEELLELVEERRQGGGDAGQVGQAGARHDRGGPGGPGDPGPQAVRADSADVRG